MKDKKYICEASADNMSKLKSIGIKNGCQLIASDKTIIMINNEFWLSPKSVNNYDLEEYQLISSDEISQLKVLKC